jgi:catechol 2,3-dioxygenase
MNQAHVDTPGIPPPNYRLPASAHVGGVRLAVSDLDRSVSFYRDVVGLALLAKDDATATLSGHDSPQPLLELSALPGVRPIQPGSRLGLYHTAFLLPSRRDLASFVQHLRQIGVPFAGGDHLYSEAIYLTDPDGLDVEVYADRPREGWKTEGRELLSGTSAVNFRELATLAGQWAGAPAGTTVGHIHLYIGDLKQAADFYHAALGLDIMTWRFPGALFTSAGGYHHHVGLNVWAAGAPPATADDARILHWELVLPSREDVDRTAASLIAAGYSPDAAIGKSTFTDPWGITVALVSR